MKVAQLSPTLCDPMDYTVHGILQASILEWVAFPFSSRSSQPRDWTQVSHMAGGSHRGSPRILGCVAYLFSRGSSQPMNQTHVSCIAGKFFTSWATREADIISGGRGTVWDGAKEVQSSVSHKTSPNYVLETKKALSCPWFLN